MWVFSPQSLYSVSLSSWIFQFGQEKFRLGSAGPGGFSTGTSQSLTQVKRSQNTTTNLKQDLLWESISKGVLPRTSSYNLAKIKKSSKKSLKI